MATLVVVQGPAEGKKFALEQHRLVMIGRDHEATFQILDSKVSRYHLQIKRRDGNQGHAAIDFDSANGVYVNGERISAETPLADGDMIRIGDSSIVYSVGDDPDAETMTRLMRRHGEARFDTISDRNKPLET
jgi:pSer/pThr/pTyr-binding forkhead associated (FHA) protein